MMKDITLSVPDSVDKLATEIRDFLLAVDRALEDGWQTAGDLPAVLAAAMANLGTVMTDAKNAGADFKASPHAAGRCMAIRLSEAVEAFTKKEIT